MIPAIVIAFIMILFTMFCLSTAESNIKDLKKDLRRFENETLYRQIEPAIAEYSELKGYEDFYREGDIVYFRKNGFAHYSHMELTEIEAELAKLKDALERACPKKCAPKKRK